MTFKEYKGNISIMAANDRRNDDIMTDIRESVNEAGNDDIQLDGLRLFDVYAGKGIPDGFRSMAYSMSYRSRVKTLTVDEVETLHNGVREAMKRKGYVIR